MFKKINLLFYIIIIMVIYIFLRFYFLEKNKSDFKIALLTPAIHPSLIKIEKAFINGLKNNSNKKYKIDVFNANGDEQLMHFQLEDIFNKNYDVIATIGAHASLMAKTLSVKNGKNTPIVFLAVSRPVDLKLVSNLEKPGFNITGVVEEPDYASQINNFLKVYSDLKNILLVYNPTQGVGFYKDKEIVENILSKKNIKLNTLQVYNSNEVYSKTKSLIKDNNAILIFTDNTVVAALNSLVKLCKIYNILLLASDLDSVDNGATAGYGVYQSEHGVLGAKLVKSILENKQNIKTVSCLINNKYIFKINGDKSC